MDQEIAIRLGVPVGQAAGATRLYCEAFVDKLAPFLGAAERAAPFLAASFAGDRVFVAHRGGAVVGIAGFKLAGKGLFAPSFRQFLGEYGLSALVRWAGLALLERKEEPHCLLMDGIAVAADARGRGLGTRLLGAPGRGRKKARNAYWPRAARASLMPGMCEMSLCSWPQT